MMPVESTHESQNHVPHSIDQVQAALTRLNYISERNLATTIFLALRLQRPLFLEGEAGVGKTEIAKVLAAMLGRRLIRLQCYEGLDVAAAVYEWNYARQILQIRLIEATAPQGKVSLEAAQADLFQPAYLLKRPILQAIDPAHPLPPVLLIDELDRADEEFEAYLLEVLSDFQVTIPELGTLTAPAPPIVVITSNRTREIHDALKRRCLYQWIDYPSFEKELHIVRTKAPDAGERLAHEVVAFIQRLRQEDLFKQPGVAETLDWINALLAIGETTLSAENIRLTSGALLKYRDDTKHLDRVGIQSLLDHAHLSSAGDSSPGEFPPSEFPPGESYQ